MSKYNVVKHIGTIAVRPNGYRKEVNLISWNNGLPKIDIREWDADHTHYGKGIAIHEDEAQIMCALLFEHFKEAEK